MHTSFEADQWFLSDMKINVVKYLWKLNVDIGLSCIFRQSPDWKRNVGFARSNGKYDGTKIGHPKSVQITLVPSPTAATLHSLHYHKVNVFDEQNKIKLRNNKSWKY